MNNYKQWTGEFRKKSLKLTQRAQRLGWIAYPKECRRCGQKQGIIHTHNEDYDVTYYTLTEVFDRFPISITQEELEKLRVVLEPICWTCHMMHHSKHRNALAVERYENAVKSGHQYPPVFKHDFSILRKYGV